MALLVDLKATNFSNVRKLAKILISKEAWFDSPSGLIVFLISTKDFETRRSFSYEWTALLTHSYGAHLGLHFQDCSSFHSLVNPWFDMRPTFTFIKSFFTIELNLKKSMVKNLLSLNQGLWWYGGVDFSIELCP